MNNTLNPNNTLGGKTLTQWKADKLDLLGARLEWETKRKTNNGQEFSGGRGFRSQSVDDQCGREIAHIDRQIEVVEKAISSLIVYGSRSLYPGGLPSNDGPVTAGGNQ